MNRAQLPAFVEVDGRTYATYQGRVILDWSRRQTLHHTAAGCRLCGTGRAGRIPYPCVYCGRTCHFRDDDKRLVHRACLEDALTAAALRARSAV